MKIRITALEGRETSGIFGGDGQEIAPGTEFDVHEEPAAWKGRYVVVEGSTKGKTAVVNKTPDELAKEELEKHTVVELKKIAEDEKVDLKDATAKGDIVAHILAARAKG